MLKAVNAPIHLFMEYVNRFFPTDEEVVILVVDQTLEFEEECEGLIGTDEETGVTYLGRYWRQVEEPHVILVRKELSVFDTVSVLAHEYVHHLLWEDKMLEMSDEVIHEIPKFGMLWDGIAAGCMGYIGEIGEKFGFSVE